MDNYIKALKGTIELCNIIIDNTGQGGITGEQKSQAINIKTLTMAELRSTRDKLSDMVNIYAPYVNDSTATERDKSKLDELEAVICDIESLEARREQKG
jgi:hypothetical protein